MESFIKVAKLSELPEHGGKFIRLEDDEIALFKIDGRVFAVNNVCPHQHISALHQGELHGLKVTCPMHGWTYSLETGAAEGGSGRLRTYRVNVEDGFVWIEKPSPAW